MPITTYCSVDDLSEFLTHDEGEIDGSSWPDTSVMTHLIRLSAAEINVALQASNQLACTKDDNTSEFLKLLNVIGAALMTEYDNARFWTDETKRRFQQWKDQNIELLRTGQLAVCAGETGLEYPAVATAEVAYTPEGAAKIIWNYELRSGT